MDQLAKMQAYMASQFSRSASFTEGKIEQNNANGTLNMVTPGRSAARSEIARVGAEEPIPGTAILALAGGDMDKPVAICGFPWIIG